MANSLNIFQEVDLTGIMGAGFDTLTDSLVMIRDEQTLIEGAGFATGTDGLKFISDIADGVKDQTDQMYFSGGYQGVELIRQLILNDIDIADVGVGTLAALDTAITGSPTANSINEILRNAGLGELMLPAGIYPTEDLVHSNDTEITGITDDVYTKKKEIVCSVNGVIRVKFDYQQSGGITTYARIYKNGVAFGTEQSTSSLTYVTETEDLLFEAGDTIELWMKRSTPSGAMAVRNFRLYGIVVTEMTNSITG